jgi:hypothetical protein
MQEERPKKSIRRAEGIAERHDDFRKKRRNNKAINTIEKTELKSAGKEIGK